MAGCVHVSLSATLLETGKIDWKPTEPVLSLDEMIREYEKAHGELAPALERVDDQTWNEKPPSS